MQIFIDAQNQTLRASEVNDVVFFVSCLSVASPSTITPGKVLLAPSTVTVAAGQWRHASHSCLCSLHTSLTCFLELSSGVQGMSGEV